MIKFSKSNDTGISLVLQCYDDTGLYGDRRESVELPPPGYDDVMKTDKLDGEEDDPDLPSYETALQLSGQGYV